jgi:hypothetical protein
MPAKVVLLFGAGASYGAGGMDRPPPLGPKLYSELCHAYRGTWRNIRGYVEEIHRRFEQKGFECGMQALYDDPYRENPDLNWLLRDMAIFFSRFTIDRPRENYYVQLLHRYRHDIAAGDVAIATLNYECLIELAAGHIGLGQIRYKGGGPGVRLLKLHGSCNFIPQNLFGDPHSVTINVGRDIIFDAPTRYVLPAAVESELGKVLLPPQMSLYTQQKHNVVNPDATKDTVSEFERYVFDAECVVSVGVRPNDCDVHVWGPIRETNSDAYLVAEESECRQWMEKHREAKTNVYFVGDTFCGTLPQIYSTIDGVLGK